MELVWHNGQFGVQNQNQRLFRKPSPPSKSQQHHMPPSHPTEQPPPPPEIASTTHLFMQEDEMTSWLHYPLDDDTSLDQHITDLFYNPPGPSAVPPSSSARALPPADLSPPPPPPAPQPHHQYLHHKRPPAHPSAVGINFPHFARLKARVPESGQSTNNAVRESTVVDSSDTAKSSLLPVWSSSVKFSGGAIAGMSTVGTNLMARPPSDDRKRKGIASEDAVTSENQSEDLEIESYEEKKQHRGTASGKRSRAAQVHNLSERKRRDRINEKMKALQELIPRCTKTDKASMLDEAIEYMKSLQMQLQMISMGYYGMVPMMFPGVQQYMPLGMGMEMGMNRPMVPFPVQTPGASSSMGPRFQFPAFHTPPIPAFDPTRVQTNHMESVGNSNCPSGANIYQQYLGPQQMPVQHLSENPPPISTPSTSKASTSKEAEDNENHPSGTDMHYSRSQ